MPRTVPAATLKEWLHDDAEIALLDVREAGQFGESHLFYAIPLPYSRLEIDVERLVPRKSTRTVLADDGGSGVAALAARRLEGLGYTAVHVLEGGTAGWKAAGFELFAGVNVPSKAFGELVEHAWHTPRLAATDLEAMRARGENFVIVDGRPLAEYRKMNIPGGVCCPNGELALRIRRIAPDPATKIVVNCAGRTRSIIGAETLRRFGVPNEVVALENGTQGWFLAGLALENGADRRYPAAPTAAELEALRVNARAVLDRFSIPQIDATTADAWLADTTRTTFLFDVRTEEEFAAATLRGAVHAPGGQLVQATDQWVGVRGARMLLADDDGVRAPMIAMWLRQMGHDAAVLRDGIAARLAFAGHPANARLPDLARADSIAGTRLLDLRPSMSYRAKHARGAQWTIRPRIAAAAAGAARVTLVADDPRIGRLAAIDLAEAGITDVRLAPGDLPTESSPGTPADAECIDFLFFTAKRHEGDREAALQYLRWEVNLLNQLDDREKAGFRILATG